MLADEPTKGLDERRIALVTETLNLLKTETLLCVTHDMNFAGTISEKICVMYAAAAGRVWGCTGSTAKSTSSLYTQT